MSEDFNLPASSIEEVNKIIAGYAALDKPSTLADVSKATGGVPESTVSRNSKFLVSVGIIESGAKKASTDVGKRLGNALSHNLEDEVREAYAEIVSDSEFLKNILSAVRIRKGMEESSLRAHIAYSAGAKKSGYTTAGAGTIIQILRMTGHLNEEDGKLVVGSTSTQWQQSENEIGTADREKLRGIPAPPAIRTTNEGLRVQIGDEDSPFAISIDVKVTCTTDDLENLGRKLRKVVDDFSQKPQSDENDQDATAN
tara:strand:+ start:436 stop:1200 length:765 start_codon:yes stop_codon:yes gene_type:complete